MLRWGVQVVEIVSDGELTGATARETWQVSPTLFMATSLESRAQWGAFRGGPVPTGRERAGCRFWLLFLMTPIVWPRPCGIWKTVLPTPWCVFVDVLAV